MHRYRRTINSTLSISYKKIHKKINSSQYSVINSNKVFLRTRKSYKIKVANVRHRHVVFLKFFAAKFKIVGSSHGKFCGDIASNR